MATCPLCSERAGKRYCPAKRTHICSVCCGTKREVEIECPSDCSYLKVGRSYESGKRLPPAQTLGAIRQFDETFFYQYGPVILSFYREIIEERDTHSGLLDSDVIEVYKALTSTLKTLSSGLIYESMPEGVPARTILFRRLKTFLDSVMNPADAEHRPLRLPEAQDILEFLAASAAMNTGDRPKSRRYLDWLTGMMAESAPRKEGRIILP